MMISITVSTWRAVAWFRLMSALRFIVGEERAGRWAIGGAWRLARWRIGNGRWRRFERTS